MTKPVSLTKKGEIITMAKTRLLTTVTMTKIAKPKQKTTVSIAQNHSTDNKLWPTSQDQNKPIRT